MEKEKKLTVKQSRFIKEYIKTGNGTQSAIKAGYSKDTAYSIANENLNKPEIKRKIELTMSEEAKKLGITAEHILGNLKRFADKKTIKWATHAVKSNEILAKHLNMFPENTKVLDVRLSEHKAIIEELSKDD
jgi:phage terminase small subunit